MILLMPMLEVSELVVVAPKRPKLVFADGTDASLRSVVDVGVLSPR
jgi:hypothetical protein